MKLDFTDASKDYAPLIAISGGDGTGKTSLQDIVVERIRGKGIPFVESMEPTLWWRNDKNVRHTLFGESAGQELSPRAVAYFSLADRLNHLDQVLKPTLSSGTAVVSNRCVLDMFAHYMVTKELDLDWLRRAAGFSLRPTYVCVLVGDPGVVVERVRTRDGEDPDRYDQSLPFVEANMNAFAELGHANGFAVLDSTSQSPDQLADKVEDDLVQLLGGL